MAVKVGILGSGYMGRTHGRILRRDGRVELAGVYDIDPQRKEAAAAELECRSAESEDQLLEWVQAVYVTVPNTAHAATSERALRRGKHVFCEKPFATSIEDAVRLNETCRSSGQVFAVGHNRRFAPVYKELREFLSEREPTLAQFKMNRGDLVSPPWVGDTRLTGGFLYETPIHLLDIAAWLFGDVAEMQAVASVKAYSEPDNWSLLLSFSSGVSLTFTTCAHATWSFPFERVEVYGRYFTAETVEMERASFTDGLNNATTSSDFHALPVAERWGYAGIDSNFISAVLGEIPPAVSAEDGLRSVELVDRCYRLSRERV